MKKFYKTIVICLLSIVCYSQNDLCVDAIEITPASACNPTAGSFSGATISTTVPNCATGASQDVWYKFVATEKMNLITLTGTSGISNGFEVYESSCAGTKIICANLNNAAGSSESSYYANFVIGQTYFIRVFNAYTATSNGSFTICVQSFTAPSNDLCANAITLTPNANCVQTTVNLSGATLDGNSSTTCSPNPSQDVWYKFTATDEMMSINITGVSDISNAFEVYQGSCSGTMIICRNANGQGSGEFLYYNHFVIGTTYYIRVINAYVTPSVSSFSICLQNYPAPANDLCANAASLTPDSNCNYIVGTFSGANLDGNPSTSCSPNSSQDVWYKFTATNATMTIKITGITDISDAFEVYSGGCSGTMIICRNLNGGGAAENITYNSFTVGSEYYIRVENAYATPLSIATFGICLQDTALGMTEHGNNSVQVFPNPVNDFVKVLNIEAGSSYELFSSVGQLVKKGTLDGNEIDVQNLEIGIYLLKISNQYGSITRKIIKG